jgi:hypothetical protein
VSSGDPCSPDDCNEEADTCEPQESIECSTNALGSAFFLLPGVVIIQGTGTEFTQLGSQVYYDPPVVIPFFKTVNPDGKTITQLVIVLPSILPRVPTYGTTVTVTVDGLTDDIGIGRFPF